MPSPTAQQGRDMFNSDSASRAASDSTSEAASRGDSGHLRIPSMGKQQSFQKRRSPASKPDCTATDKARDQVKPPSNAEAGQRGQSQYAQFLHRSSVGPPTNQDIDSQPLLRRSSSLGAASRRDAKPSDAQPSSLFSKAVASILPGKRRSLTPASEQVTAAAEADDDINAQKLERQPSSRVHAVAAHQSSDGDCDSADHVQEAASHREQMAGVVGGQTGGAAGAASQPQACPQPKRKPPERQLTFQEMLRQQIEVSFMLRTCLRSNPSRTTRLTPTRPLLLLLPAISRQFHGTTATYGWLPRLATSVPSTLLFQAQIQCCIPPDSVVQSHLTRSGMVRQHATPLL